jgi:hypothetical protein
MSPVPFRDFEDDESEPACEACVETQAKLARAHQLLRAIARVEPKPAKAEMLDDPADSVVIGYVVALATIRARVELYLRSTGARP